MTAKFDHIFNWKLLRGSHEFPGPEGGTCINEAAIIAAGMKYRAVNGVDDCPPCFSRPLAQYLISVNDLLPDGERQRLMPFVLRLSGSADVASIEQRRAEIIVLRTTQRVLPLALRAVGLDAQARRCAEVSTFAECRAECRAAAHAAYAAAAAAAHAYAAAAHAYAADAAHAYAADAADAAYAAAYAAYAAYAAAADAARGCAAEIYSVCISIAEEAFAIGNQAAPSDIVAVSARLDAARCSA